jgi:hypothetical protein
LINYSVRVTDPVSFILVRQPREDTPVYTFTGHSIPWALVRILSTNIETPTLCLPFSQLPPRMRSNSSAIACDSRDQRPANLEPVGILIAVSKAKNICIV